MQNTVIGRETQRSEALSGIFTKGPAFLFCNGLPKSRSWSCLESTYQVQIQDWPELGRSHEGWAGILGSWGGTAGSPEVLGHSRDGI